MKLMIMFMLALSVLAVAPFAALAQPSTTFDSMGRTTGTATTNGNGTTTFRDASGRTTGVATTNGNGTTTFHDASGRTTGTAKRR